MKKILYSLLLLLAASSFIAQAQEAAVKIDGQVVYLKAGNSLPYWLKAGQSIAPSKNVSFLSGIEFNSDSTNHVLKYDQVIKIASSSTVPIGKVWKIEAIAYDTLIAATNLSTIQVPSNGTYSSGGSGGSTANTPQIYQSPIKFNTPGTYQWYVPPGVTNICVELWGGGGGGGTVTTYPSYPASTWASVNGGGGGAGAYGYQCLIVVPGTLHTIVVGDGGTIGNAGIASKFDNVSAGGGGAGGVASYNTQINGAGGLLGVSNASFYPTAYGNGTPGGYNGGEGGKAYLGGAGATSLYGCLSGPIPAVAPGGGGAGSFVQIQSGYAYCNMQGNKGASGQVIIYW